MRRLIFSLILFAWLVVPLNILAQSQGDVEARRAQLQAELEAEERAIAVQTKLLQAKQHNTATVAGEVELLQSQINRAKKSIEAKKLAIVNLQADIARREDKIETLAAKIKRQQESLAELLRQTRDVDSLSFVEVMFQEESLTDVFRNVSSFEPLQEALERSFATMRSVQAEAHQEKLALEEKKDAETDNKQVIEREKKLIEKRESERKIVLAINKKEEAAYQKILDERRRRAAQIRSALFALRDTAAIPFGRALEYATAASQKTGVRPAFLLAILTQESNLGENVGTCNRPGDPPKRRWRAIMPGPGDKSKRNDEAAYLRITAALGLDPEAMPLSCPWQGGWGGAMGPAQFIPTTWEKYATRVAQAVGHNPANPWEPEDAFIASAIYLADLGAGRGTYTAERTAALKYYAGSAWQNPKNAFYGNEVMSKAEDIQLNMIDPLQNS